MAVKSGRKQPWRRCVSTKHRMYYVFDAYTQCGRRGRNEQDFLVRRQQKNAQTQAFSADSYPLEYARDIRATTPGMSSSRVYPNLSARIL